MKRSRSTTTAGILALLGAAVLAGWYWFSQKADALVLSGTIEAKTVDVGSLVGGRILAVHVAEGDRVAAGDVLAEFETDGIDREIDEQEARVEEARAALDRVVAGPRREELNRARVQWTNAERERLRLEALLRDGIIARQQYDAAAAQAESLLESLKELEAGSRTEDVRQAASTLREAEARMAYLQQQRREATVTSPVDGVVQTMDLEPGDLVPANRPLATVLEPTRIWVRVYVPETKLGLVRVGQRVAVEVDSFPGRSFPGEIAELSERGEYTPRNLQTVEQREDEVFAAKVHLEPAPELKAGMVAMTRIDPAAAGSR